MTPPNVGYPILHGYTIADNGLISMGAIVLNGVKIKTDVRSPGARGRRGFVLFSPAGGVLPH